MTEPYDPRGPIDGVSPPPPPLTARRAVGIVLVYFAAQVVAGVAVMVAVTGYYTPRIQDPAALTRQVRDTYVLPAAVLGIVLGGLAVLRLTRRLFAGHPPGEARRTLAVTRARGRDVAAGAALGIALSLFYAWVAAALGPGPSQPGWNPIVAAASEPGWRRNLWALVAVLLAPPVEEFLFRGVLFGGLVRSWGTGWAAVVVTVVFAMLHLPETRFYWPAILAVTTLAAVTIAVRIRTGSLGPSVAVHAAYNIGLVAMVYAG